MVLLSSYIGIPVGEFAFIFFYSIPGDPVIGDYSWRRGDELDAVSIKHRGTDLNVDPLSCIISNYTRHT